MSVRDVLTESQLADAVGRMHVAHGPMVALDLIVSHPIVGRLAHVLAQLEVRVVVHPHLQPDKWVLVKRDAFSGNIS